MENNRFEDSFRNAFDGAEIAPSEAVWTNIELTLEKNSGGKLKRNLLLFQLLAAASVVFACGIGALYFLDGRPSATKEFSADVPKETEISSPAHNPQTDNGHTFIQPENPSPQTFQTRSGERKPAAFDAIEQANVNRPAGNQNIVVAQAGVLTQTRASGLAMHSISRRDISTFMNNPKPVFAYKPPAKSEPDPVMVMMARLSDEENKYRNEKNAKPHENVWASVGFGAGSYKPNRQALNNSYAVTGDSYSAGLNIGGKISKRLIVQGGVSYLTQNANFTSTVSTQGAAVLNEYVSNVLFTQDKNGPANPYVVNSSLQFVSIPFQAGYLIVDRAFGLQLNGGIATDLFVNNTLSPQDGNYQRATQTAGKNSPYRTVNFSGLLGTEFSYRIADQYRVSLNPGLRYSLNSIYKPEITASITPVTFDVSLRFRYIFK